MPRLRIAFMGTPNYILPVLEVLHDSGHNLVCVYTQPPRARGRGHETQKSDAHLWAESRNIPVRTPLDFKNEKDITEFRALNLDVAVVAAYGMLLPQTILDATKYGCINIHPSLLPRWRGTSPVQYTIWQGDAEGGVSVMKLVRGMDAGPIIAVRRIAIPPRIKYEELLKQFWVMGSEMIAGIIKNLGETGNFPLTPQAEEGVTYTKMLTRDDGRIDWIQDAAAIDRQVRALNPWPSTFTLLNGRRMKILSASPSSLRGEGQGTGLIMDKQGHVLCGNGTVLQIQQLQPEGKSAMEFSSALNGGHISIGGIFS